MPRTADAQGFLAARGGAGLAPLAQAIGAVLREKGRCVAALDGMAAAGKTTAAALLCEAFGGACVHTVSYTHLDVYKRQGICPRRPICAVFRLQACGCAGGLKIASISAAKPSFVVWKLREMRLSTVWRARYSTHTRYAFWSRMCSPSPPA